MKTVKIEWNKSSTDEWDAYVLGIVTLVGNQNLQVTLELREEDLEDLIDQSVIALAEADAWWAANQPEDLESILQHRALRQRSRTKAIEAFKKALAEECKFQEELTHLDEKGS